MGNHGEGKFNILLYGAAASVAMSLVVQIGEQVDFLRFLPRPTPQTRARWWLTLVCAGPGWIVPGVLKLLAGSFLAFLALQHEVRAEHAGEPTQMYLTAFSYVFFSPAAAVDRDRILCGGIAAQDQRPPTPTPAPLRGRTFLRVSRKAIRAAWCGWCSMC